jgi:type IV pilus assembly protein PilM
MFGRVTSIELGMLKTRICELDYRKKTARVYRCISFDTPADAVQDGYLNDTGAIISCLKSKLKEGGFKSKRLIFTVASTRIVSREVSIPYVNKKRINEIVKANSADYFPVDIKGSIIRYSILEKYTADKEKRLRLLILAVPENLVSSYYELASRLGCELTAVDYVGNSICQAMGSRSPDSHLLVHIGEQMTFLNMMENGAISLPKTVHFGLINMLEAVKEKLTGIISDNEALEQLLRGKVLNWQQDTSLQYLSSSILRIMDFYSRNQDKKIQAIILTGQAIGIAGLKEYLQKELGVQVISRSMDCSFRFAERAEPDEAEKAAYAACIGAAAQPIGFVPREQLERSRKNNYIHNLLFTIMAGALTCGILVSSSYFSFRNTALKNKVLTGELSDLELVNDIYEEYNISIEQLKEISTIYELTQNPNDQFLKLLAELEKKLPQGVTVETLRADSQGVTLTVRANSEITAAMTLKQLKTIPLLTGISTDGLSFSTDENGIMTVYFIVNGCYQPSTFREVQDDGIAKENIGS